MTTKTKEKDNDVSTLFEKVKTYSQPYYSDDENEYWRNLIYYLERARDMREDTHIEFDDRDYISHYDSNYKAGNAYLRPKKNKFDSRIVTGTTLEKENTFLSMILNYNFEPNIEVYDKKDMPLMGLGDKIESLVKKSFQIEGMDDKEALILKEAADQGTAFVEDTWVEEWEIQKVMKKVNYSDFKIDDVDWTTTRKRKVVGCRTNLIPGTGVYLGNINEFFMEEQPYVYTRDVIPYSEAEKIYSGYNRFENVSRDLITTLGTEDSSDVRDWTLEEMNEDMVEVIKYKNKSSNEYMLLLNGVMMLPIGFPLSEVSPSSEYNLVKIDIEPISKFFAYSKSFPAKTKVDQEILDDTLRTMVLRLRQMQQPPMANNTGTVLSQNIFFPGKITPDVQAGDLEPLIQNNTIGAGEFNVYNLIKQIVDEKTMNPIMSGQQAQGDPTATQIMEEKRQSMMKLGYAVYGILSFWRRLTWLRIYNILYHWTMPMDNQLDEVKQQIREMYRNISVDAQDEFGEFTRVIEFDNEGLGKEQEQLDAEAQILSTPGNQVQKVYLNGKKLRKSMLEYKFYINITPTPKESTELERTLFIENLARAKQIFGPESTNDEYLKGRYAIMSKEDPEKYWAKEQPQMPMVGAPGGAPVSEQIGQQVAKPQQPSINTLVK